MLNFKNICLGLVSLFATSSAYAECVPGVDFFEDAQEFAVVENAQEIAIEPVQETVTETAVMVDTVDVDDFEYVQAVHRRTANYDYRSVQTDNG